MTTVSYLNGPVDWRMIACLVAVQRQCDNGSWHVDSLH